MIVERDRKQGMPGVLQLLRCSCPGAPIGGCCPCFARWALDKNLLDSVGEVRRLSDGHFCLGFFPAALLGTSQALPASLALEDEDEVLRCVLCYLLPVVCPVASFLT